MEKLILGLICLLFQAFFSGSETGFLSIDLFFLNLRKKQDLWSKRLFSLLKNQDNILYISLIGTNLSVIAATQLISLYIGEKPWKYFFMVFVFPFFILIIGEIIPKLYYLKKPYYMSKLSYYPFRIFYIIFYPIIIFLKIFSKIFDSLLRVKKENENLITKEKANHIVKNSLIKIFDNKNIFIEELFGLGEEKAFYVKSPLDFYPIIFETNPDKVKTQIYPFIENKTNRFIIISVKDKSRILGYIDINEYLSNYFSEDRFIIHTPNYVSEKTKVFDLIELFKNKDLEILFVINEFGFISGVITKDEVFSRLFGEFFLKEEDETFYLEKISEQCYICKGFTNIDVINKVFKQNIAKDRFSTISGFLEKYSGQIPEENEKILYNDLEFEIISAKPNKIEKIKITWKNSESF